MGRCAGNAGGEPNAGCLSPHTNVVSWHVEIMAALLLGLCDNVRGKENGRKLLKIVHYYF